VTSARLFPLAGIAAIIGGLMRLAEPLGSMWLPPGELSVFYFAIDVFLLLGLTGIYSRWSASLGWAGLVAFLLCFIGLLVIRSYGSSAYILGAGMFSFGLASMGALLLRTAFPKYIAGLWIASFIVGLTSLALPQARWPILTAGILFSLGFIAAGIAMAGSRRLD
jgi:hypothetical protein